jgi:hypothetical protein
MTKPEGAPELDHPCRDTCSGWKQGYEKGKDELQGKCEALEKERDEFKAAFNIMEERSQFYFKEICDHNKKILEWDEVYKNKLNDNNKLQARFTELLGLANEMRENLKSDLVDDYECEIKFDDFKKREGL